MKKQYALFALIISLFLSLTAAAQHRLPVNSDRSANSTKKTQQLFTLTGDAPSALSDGTFEQNTNEGTNPFWTSTSTEFGTSLCTITACGTGGGAGAPFAGNGWVWFDGTGDGTTAESGTAQQTLVIENGIDTLTFMFRAGAVTAPSSSVLTVSIDGNVVRTITEPATAQTAYTMQSVDISAYGNGASHTILFSYNRPAGTSGSDNFLIDNVALADLVVQGSTVSGVVTDSTGRGIANAVITFTDAQNNVRRTRTTSFGFYTITGVADAQYTVTATARRYQFQSQVLTVNGANANLNFIAQ